MDTTYISQLFLSMLIFAPGVILFVGLAFVGLLMVLERTVFSGQDAAMPRTPVQPVDVAPAANPGPGRIVDAIKQGAQQPEAKRAHAEKTNRRA